MTSKGEGLRRRSQHFHAPGVAGRATGLRAKDNVRKDAHGLEDVDDFFDSDREEAPSDVSELNEGPESSTNGTAYNGGGDDDDDDDDDEEEGVPSSPYTSSILKKRGGGSSSGGAGAHASRRADSRPSSRRRTGARGQMASSTPINSIKKKLRFEDDDIASPIQQRGDNVHEDEDEDDDVSDVEAGAPAFDLGGDEEETHSPALPLAKAGGRRSAPGSAKRGSGKVASSSSGARKRGGGGGGGRRRGRGREDDEEDEEEEEEPAAAGAATPKGKHRAAARRGRGRKSGAVSATEEEEEEEEGKAEEGEDADVKERGKRARKGRKSSVAKGTHKKTAAVRSPRRGKRSKVPARPDDDDEEEEDNEEVESAAAMAASPAVAVTPERGRTPSKRNAPPQRTPLRNVATRRSFQGEDTALSDLEEGEEEEEEEMAEGRSENEEEEEEEEPKRKGGRGQPDASTAKGRKSKAGAKKKAATGKTARAKQQQQKKKTKPSSSSQMKRETQDLDTSTAGATPINPRTGRPQRTRVKPLAFWKGERVVYEPVVTKGKRTGLMQVKDVVLVDTPKEHQRKTRKRTGQTTQARSTRAKRGPKKEGEDDGGEEAVPEEGEEDEEEEEVSGGKGSKTRTRVVEKIVTQPPQLDMQKLENDEVTVKDWEADNGTEVSIGAIKTYPMNDWRTPGKGGMRFCKSFSLPDARWSAGQIELEPGASKQRQSTKRNFLVFTVTAGTLRVHIHNDAFDIGLGTCFYVPPDNFYSLHNTGSDTVRAFFVQVKANPNEAQGAPTAATETA